MSVPYLITFALSVLLTSRIASFRGKLNLVDSRRTPPLAFCDLCPLPSPTQVTLSRFFHTVCRVDFKTAIRRNIKTAIMWSRKTALV
jgi:hypothetical protein